MPKRRLDAWGTTTFVIHRKVLDRSVSLLFTHTTTNGQHVLATPPACSPASFHLLTGARLSTFNGMRKHASDELCHAVELERILTTESRGVMHSRDDWRGQKKKRNCYDLSGMFAAALSLPSNKCSAVERGCAFELNLRLTGNFATMNLTELCAVRNDKTRTSMPSTPLSKAPRSRCKQK